MMVMLARLIEYDRPGISFDSSGRPWGSRICKSACCACRCIGRGIGCDRLRWRRHSRLLHLWRRSCIHRYTRLASPIIWKACEVPNAVEVSTDVVSKAHRVLFEDQHVPSASDLSLIGPGHIPWNSVCHQSVLATPS